MQDFTHEFDVDTISFYNNVVNMTRQAPKGQRDFKNLAPPGQKGDGRRKTHQEKIRVAMVYPVTDFLKRLWDGEIL